MWVPWYCDEAIVEEYYEFLIKPMYHRQQNKC